jgi:GT2 family glycosyltransferase
MIASSPNENGQRPPVSIVLVGYNHLDCTKLCVESLYRHTPANLYELITVDNGSSDGTRAYFDGLPNRKKLSFPENIGVDKAMNRAFEQAEGEYILNLSNDIILTENWLQNLMTCMESDERIAMAVPVCGFSSNNQQVGLQYNTLEQMQHIAAEYNRSDPLKWEERLKLVTYVCLFRRSPLLAAGGFDEDFTPGAYDDDAISFTIRRAGWKLMLAVDTYVHHFGSVTFNEEYAKSNFAARNRALFMRKFGVDSWAAVWIDFNIVALAGYGRKGPVDMLGVGRTCGSTLLQVKNMFRKRGVMDVSMDYLSESEGNLTDLKTICRDCVQSSPADFLRESGGREYDLIIVESDTGKLADAAGFFGDLAVLLKRDGQLITTATEASLPAILGALAGKGLIVTRQANNYFSFSRSS